MEGFAGRRMGVYSEPIEGQKGNSSSELGVAPADLGKVIGKHSPTAVSIRNILGAAGMKMHRRFTLEILE
jgi:predicted RNA-binding protein YlqC (UPF0109 family)